MPLSYGCNQCWSLPVSAHQFSFYVTARNVFSFIQTLWWTSLYTTLGHQQKRTKIRQRESFHLAFARVSQIKNAFASNSGAWKSLSFVALSTFFSRPWLQPQRILQTISPTTIFFRQSSQNLGLRCISESKSKNSVIETTQREKWLVVERSRGVYLTWM